MSTSERKDMERKRERQYGGLGSRTRRGQSSDWGSETRGKDATDLNYTTPARAREFFSQGRANSSIDWRDEARTMDGWVSRRVQKGFYSGQG